MKKLRLSYSLLTAWERGQIEDAVNMYFHTGSMSSPQIEFGLKFHQDMADHITKYNSFPDWFFTKDLILPQCEREVVVDYNEMFTLKAVFDCYDNPNLYEFKTGKQPSSDWCRTFQLPLYFEVAELAGIEVEKAFLIRHNQYKNETDYSMVYNNKRQRDKARNLIDSVGPEIYNFFEEQGLLYEKKDPGEQIRYEVENEE